MPIAFEKGGCITIGNGNENLKHVHVYEGNTTCDKAHSHLFTGTTGPEIETRDGRHYHDFEGMTSYDFEHWHGVLGKTGLDEMLPDGFHTHRMSFTTKAAKEHRHMADTFGIAAKETHNSPKTNNGRKSRSYSR